MPASREDRAKALLERMKRKGRAMERQSRELWDMASRVEELLAPGDRERPPARGGGGKGGR